MKRGPRTVAVVKTPTTSASVRALRACIAVEPHAEKADAVPSDEIEIARRRMHHLRYRNIEPLPRMHSVIGGIDQRMPDAQRASYRQIALHVLAVQMWQANPKSALR